MAPEQAMGEREITPKADIYALGCVLYEMLTGEPPFTGPTAQAIIARVVTEEPRSLTLQRKTIPPYVEAAIRTALQKLPADRFSSAAQFAQALRNPAFAGVAAPAAAAAGARRSLIPDARRLAPWLAASVVAAVALAGGFLSGRLTAPKPPSRLAQFFIEPPESVTGFNRCCGRALAISPDGSTLVFVGVRGSSGPLYRRTLGRLGAEPIPGTEGASIPIFSPDGRWLAFHSDGRLRKVSMAGGPAVPITSAEQVVGASWGEGDIIVYSSQRRLWSVRAAGGQPQPLTSPDSNTRHFFPFVLPGGRAVVFSIRDASGNLELSRIGVMRFGRETVDTVAFGARAEYASGFLVYTGADNTLLAQPFDAERLVPLGEAVAIQDRIRLAGGSNHEFSVSAEGTLVFQPGAGGSGGGEVLRIFGPGGRTAVQLPGRSDVNLEDPAASPDGRLIALRLPTGGATSQDLWILDRQQGTLERFTVGGGAAPAWSRNGRLIAYYADSGQGGPAGIYVKASDQTGPARLVAAGTSLFPGSWLPDGRTIVFQSRADLEANIGMVAIGDSAPTWLVATEFREAHPQASPDGRWLAYVSNRTGQNEVFVQPLRGEGGRTQISTEGATAPRWSPDGRTLYYVAGGAVVAARLGFGPSVRVSERRIVVDGGVTDLNGTNVNWDVFSNGGEFIYIDQQGTGAARLVWMLNWTELVRGMRTSQ
ncbi:MAG TPA: hypothetical protein VNL98_03855, partial [Gemmatimonadales bacterium]|nr:hypothetical protein [Gemmatimonadales bacterium]